MKRIFDSMFGSGPERSPARPRHGFRPQLDPLEGRDCASVSTLYSLGTLTITGDSLANHVVIHQIDGSNQLKVYSSGNLLGTFNAYQVQTVNINLLGGNDSLNYTLIGSHFNNSKVINLNLGSGHDDAYLDFRGNDATVFGTLDINVEAGSGADELYTHIGHKHGGHVNLKAEMGAGHDTAHAMMWGDVSGAADVLFDVKGEGGADALGAWCTYDDKANAYNNIKITGDSTLAIKLDGGLGADSIGPLFSGEVDGHLTLIARGGAGDDDIDADVYLQPGSTGSFFGRVSGQADDDTLAFHVWDLSGAAVIDAVLNGGAGFDTGSSSGNVSKVSIEA
jgi:hypothetical protein